MRSKATVHNAIGDQGGISESVDLGPFTPLPNLVAFTPPRRRRSLH